MRFYLPPPKANSDDAGLWNERKRQLDWLQDTVNMLEVTSQVPAIPGARHH
jgi:hypothetical protein